MVDKCMVVRAFMITCFQPQAGSRSSIKPCSLTELRLALHFQAAMMARAAGHGQQRWTCSSLTGIEALGCSEMA